MFKVLRLLLCFCMKKHGGNENAVEEYGRIYQHHALEKKNQREN